MEGEIAESISLGCWRAKSWDQAPRYTTSISRPNHQCPAIALKLNPKQLLATAFDWLFGSSPTQSRILDIHFLAVTKIHSGVGYKTD